MEFSDATKRYWRDEDFKDLEKVESIKDLFTIAERIIERMPKPFVQVCGPITTGGLGSTEANLKVFNETVIKLQNKGLTVFDQMPYESTMQRLQDELVAKGDYLHNILTDFYYPLFNSGFISAFYFIPGWESSFGAKKEHEKAQELKIPIVYL
jgi:hypothetical protein